MSGLGPWYWDEYNRDPLVEAPVSDGALVECERLARLKDQGSAVCIQAGELLAIVAELRVYRATRPSIARMGSAIRSAIYLIRKDGTDIAKMVQAELRGSLRAANLRAIVRMPWTVALTMCLEEIEQFHSTAYPTCDGDCPAHRAMAAAKTALRFDAPL